MADPTLAEPLATPPLDTDFLSEQFPISLEDFDFTFDFDFPDPDSLYPNPQYPSGVSADVAGFFSDSINTADRLGDNYTGFDDVAGCGRSRGDYDVADCFIGVDRSRVSDDVADLFNVSSTDSIPVKTLDDPFEDSADVAGFLNVSSSEDNSGVLADVDGFLNVSSSEDNSRVLGDVAGFGHVESPDSMTDKISLDPFRVSDYPSPGPASSHGSGNSGNSTKIASLSPVSAVSNNSRNRVVDEKSKSEEESNNSALKRKKNSDSEIRTSKYRKQNSETKGVISDGDEKKKTRLERNRESAQLSRQRKKHYVEELEDKVRAMHSTIHDLNSRISYAMAENASLRMQANGVPPAGMYPPPPMGYPWAPYPPYMMKGSQVPLVPIPRLKPQQPVPAPKVKKSSESKKSESKTKKVASVSLLGLLFFMLLFGGLVPMVNLKFNEMNKSVTGRSEYFSNGQLLTSVNGSDRDIGIGNDFASKGHCGMGEKGGGNSSEPLVASLYVPRNDKLVKIDGNLIIQSIMASERAMASTGNGVKRSEETSLAVARNNVPTIIPLTGRNRYPHPYRGERQRALGSEKDKLISSAVDGNNLHEWFIDGLAGPMLSSGMCTEVFQFDVSPSAGAIVPADSLMNVTSQSQHLKNVTTKNGKGNRRILHGAPVPLVGNESNITEKPMGIDTEKDNIRGNKSLSSMVVSVLVDPREVGDGGVEGVMGPKSLSRIFVVVLIDSVKYVTYSCMLPLRGSATHLVTT